MKNICIIIIVAFFSIVSGYGQNFRGLSVEDGLPDLVVNAFYKDSQGFLWAGTSSSVERFDGIRFKHYDIPAKTAKEKEVNVLIGMPGNEVWFGNNAGVWKISQDSVLQVAAEEIKSKVYTLLYSDSTKCLYVGTEAGLFIYKDGKVHRELLEPNVFSPSNSVRGLALENDCLWIATQQGLYAMSLRTRKVIPINKPAGNISQAFLNICYVKDRLYLGTAEQGIIVFDIKQGKFKSYLNVGHISSLSTDGNDLLYVGTNGNGIYFVSLKSEKVTKHIQHDTTSGSGIRSNSVYSLLVDHEGIVWVGVFQMGIDYSLFQQEYFMSYQPQCDLNFKYLAVRSLEIGSDDKLIGTRDGLYYVNDRRGIFKMFKSPQLRANMILSICKYRGKYYIGTFGGGLYVFDSSSASLSDFEDASLHPVFMNGQIFSMTTDTDGKLWMATSDGLFCYEGKGKLRQYTSRNSQLPEGNVYQVYFDSTHRGWVCTENGMALISPNEDRAVVRKFPKGFIHDRLIRIVYEDSRHQLYFLSDKGHLFRSDLSLMHFEEVKRTPIDDKNLQFIIEDNEGWLWIGTNNGLYRYDKGKKWMSFGVVDGLPTSIFLGCVPRKEENGILWFGSSQGVFCTTHEKMKKKQPTPYRVQVVEVCVDNNTFLPVSLTGKNEYVVNIPSFEKLTISFSGFSYIYPEFVAYEYQLDGNGWNKLEGKSELPFYDLSSGKHELKIRRANDADSVTSIVLYRHTVWKGWMSVFIVLVILFGIYGVIHWRMKSRKEGKAQSVEETPLKLAESSVEELHTREEESEQEENMQEDEDLSSDKYKYCRMSEEDCRLLSEQLDSLMNEKRLYMNPKLKIADLAEALHIPSYKLSYLFSQYLDHTFYDYVNDFRIIEFKRLIEKGEHKSYSLNALMEKCGFMSRSSFFRHFKKHTGMTPNEYINSLEK
jgi:ligand-binding sensor domain-containing protein/AraC-like DNA-binding protein